MAEEDLAEIKRLDPSYAPASHLGELPFARRFAELRDLGLSVKEALAATNFNRLLASFSQRAARAEEKSHLRSAGPTARAPAKFSMTSQEMQSAREIFGNLSDKEIENLYKRVTL